MKALSFKNLFALLFLLFLGLLAATALQAWTGPTGTAPSANVSAPLNVSSTDQVKNAGLSLNSLLVTGNELVYNPAQTLKLGVNRESAVVALDVNGTMRLGDGGEVCQAVTEGAVRYNATTKLLEFCNGTNWKAVSVTMVTTLSATRTYDSSATWSKPANLSYIVVDVYGAGGGGACVGYSPGNGGAGGTSSFGSTSASGGGGGSGSSGAAGTGSGGDINLSGQGAIAANNGPGNGGGACYNGEYGYSGGNGGGGGYAQKTIQGADINSSTIAVTVGSGGSSGGVYLGIWAAAAGGNGRVVIREYTSQ